MAQDNKTDIDNPLLYLVSGVLSPDNTTLKKNSLRPINDVFIGLKQTNNTVTALEVDGLKLKAKAKFDSSSQVYLTNEVGAVCNFETGKGIADAAAAAIATLVTSGAINPFEKEAELYFPPQHLVQYSLARKGYAGWIDDFRGNLTQLSSSYKNEACMMIKPHTVSVKDSFIDPDTKGFKCSGAYRTWYQNQMNALKKQPDKTVTVLAMARTRAVLVTFSSKKYEDATVSITTRKGIPAFLTKLPASDKDLVLDKKNDTEGYLQKTITKVKAIRDKERNLLGYGAVFYDALGTHDQADSVEDQIYQIKVGFELEKGINKLGSEVEDYTLMERIRFPIEGAFGEFDIINGDAISVEETLIKQFPLQYPHIIQQASESRTLVGGAPAPTPLDGMVGFQFNLQNALDKTKLTGDVLSGSTMMGLRKLGTAVWGGIDGDSSILRDSVNLAFSVYDVANKLPDLMNTAISTVEVGIQSAELLNDVNNTRQLPPTLSNQLDEFITQQAARHPLPDNLLKISRSAGKAIDAMGPALDAFKVFNDAAALSTTWKDLEKAVGQYKSIINDYAHKVLVVSAEKQEEVTIEDEEKQREKIKAFIKENPNGRMIEPFADGYIINAQFEFDRAKFIADDSFNSIIELLKSINHNTLWLTLEGHTCNLGSDEYNYTLGQRRANAVEKAIREKLGKSDILIDAISKGESAPLVENTSDKNRAKNRRVYAYFKFNRINQYIPSREGIAQIERLRALTTLKKAALPDDLKKTVMSLLDCVAGTPPLNPAHAAFSALWLVGNVLVDAASFLDKAIHGEALLNSIKNFDHQQVSAATNQLLLIKAPAGDMSVTKYFDAQFRMRAEAMNGLMALLMRCSIEKSGEALERFEDENKFFNDPRTGFYDSNFGKYSDGFSYQDNLKLYRVSDYVDRFILKDGWQLSANPIFPMSLDNYWIYLLRTSQIDAKPQLPSDAAWYEKALDSVGNIADMAVDIVVSIDDFGDQFKALTKNVINGCDYIYSNQKTKGSPDRKDLLGANFQKLFPVHFLESETFETFAASMVSDFTGLDAPSIAINTLSVRARGSKKGVTWTPMGSWLNSKNKVSPFDQIRICMILNPEDETVAQFIKDDVITYVPVEACPVRVDGLNMEGPSVTGNVRKLSYSDLTTDEKELVENSKIEEADLYGAILTPSFMLGANVMYGTKPMANVFSALLNVTDEHTLRSIFNWDHTWSMDYEYEVVLGNVPGTKNTSSYYKDIKIGRQRGQSRNLTEFKLKLGASDIESSKFYKDEGILLDRHFLQIGKERESFPPLFNDAECYCLVRPNGLGDFQYSNGSWYKDGKGIHTLNKRDQLEIKNYSWHKKMQLSVLIVCDEIDVTAYKKRNISHRNIPGMVQLYRDGANYGEIDLPVNPMDPGFSAGSVADSFPFSGPSHEVAFKEMGKIELNGSNNLEFTWADHIDEKHLDSTIQLFGESMKEKNRLAVLSGIKKIDADSSWLDKIQSAMQDKSKHVYMATLDLDYQSITGDLVDGLKPFKVFAENIDEIQDDWSWNFKLKVTTQGDSGFTNDKVNGSYSLPYPKDLFDLKSKWYEVSTKRRADAFELIEKNIKILAENKTLEVEQRRPIYINPLIKWLALEGGDVNSGERRKSIHNWLNKQGSSRFLSYSKNRVMEDESDVVKLNEAESA